MRRVKRIGNFHTLETKARAEETDLLCDQCGNVECSIRGIINRVKINRFNAKLAVIRCESFLPSLDFRDGAGMDSDFNTFRLGGAWATRVGPGNLVNLRSAVDGSILGVAEVIRTHVGPFTGMAAEFGADNHLAIDAAINDRDFDLAKVMRECYGGHRFNVDSTVSVIELRRIHAASEEGA